jgi:PIN domain nuclease of toxin-antitoxin system
LPLPESPRGVIPRLREAHGFTELPLTEAAAFQLTKLPELHRDPFDRMLVCQCIEHGLTLVTPDEAIQDYPIRTLW